MNYNGKAVRTVKVEKSVKDILENGFVMDFKDYGRFSVNAKFKRMEMLLTAVIQQ